MLFISGSALLIQLRCLARAARGACLLTTGVLLAAPQVALAHPGGPLPVHSWYQDKLVVVVAVVLGWAYWNGVAARRAAHLDAQRWPRVAFLAGLLALVAALLSPLDVAGGARVATRMVQHLVLVSVAAPLLALGKPLLPLLWALPPACRPWAWACERRTLRLARLLRAALPLVLVLHVGVLGLWHTPYWYSLATRNVAMHLLELATLLLTALLFWWSLLGWRSRSSSTALVPLLSLGGAVASTATVGVLLAAAPLPWYPSSVSNAVIWAVLHPSGGSAVFICNTVAPNQLLAALLRDQQHAGFVMSVSAVSMLGFVWFYRTIGALCNTITANPTPQQPARRE